VALSQPTRVSLTPRAERSAAPDLLRVVSFLPLLVLPALAIAFARTLPAWQFMWVLALSLYEGCKSQTWWSEFLAGRAPPGRSIGYLLAWVGMDARAFLDASSKPLPSARREWVKAAAITVAGAILLWAICRVIPATHPLLVGWAGLLGLVLLLHFGTFALLSLTWRAVGIDAQPLMNRPVSATSLADFWGRRWNTAFHALAHRLAFRPLLRRVGLAGAVLGTFLVSGLIHDLMISLPARGGYGLPTVYFVIQGLGVLLERRVGRGRALTMLFTVAPVFLLFHPPFVTRVILPFLTAIRAIPGGVS
jgi:alginate O-acetyltransferase complex protein AlgI